MSGLWEATVLAYARGSTPEAQTAFEMRQLWNPDRETRSAIKKGDEKCHLALERLKVTDPDEYNAHVLGVMLEDHEPAAVVPTTYWPGTRGLRAIA